MIDADRQSSLRMMSAGLVFLMVNLFLILWMIPLGEKKMARLDYGDPYIRAALENITLPAVMQGQGISQMGAGVSQIANLLEGRRGLEQELASRAQEEQSRARGQEIGDLLRVLPYLIEQAEGEYYRPSTDAFDVQGMLGAFGGQPGAAPPTTLPSAPTGDMTGFVRKPPSEKAVRTLQAIQARLRALGYEFGEGLPEDLDRLGDPTLPTDGKDVSDAEDKLKRTLEGKDVLDLPSDIEEYKKEYQENLREQARREKERATERAEVDKRIPDMIYWEQADQIEKNLDRYRRHGRIFAPHLPAPKPSLSAPDARRTIKQDLLKNPEELGRDKENLIRAFLRDNHSAVFRALFEWGRERDALRLAHWYGLEDELEALRPELEKLQPTRLMRYREEKRRPAVVPPRVGPDRADIIR